MTRVRIGPPLTTRLPPLKTTRHSDTNYNVKAKIDNVKAKIQDKEEKRPWSRPSLARHLVFGQLAASPTSSLLKEPPRQVAASHEESGPDWCVGSNARHGHHHRRMWRNESPRHAETTAGGHADGPPRQEP
jgi:hypothetical protein